MADLVKPPPATQLDELLRREALVLQEEADACGDDLVALGAKAARLDAIMEDLRVVERSVKRRAGEVMQRRRMPELHLEGLARIVRSGGVRRSQWRHGELGMALLRASAVQGELPDGPRAVALIVEHAGIVWWYADRCSLLGVDVDEFCQREPAPWITAQDNRLVAL